MVRFTEPTSPARPSRIPWSVPTWLAVVSAFAVAGSKDSRSRSVSRAVNTAARS